MLVLLVYTTRINNDTTYMCSSKWHNLKTQKQKQKNNGSDFC